MKLGRVVKIYDMNQAQAKKMRNKSYKGV